MKPYQIPVALWVVSVVGIVLTLLGDNAWDVLGLVCLATPVVAIARAARPGASR